MKSPFAFTLGVGLAAFTGCSHEDREANAPSGAAAPAPTLDVGADATKKNDSPGTTLPGQGNPDRSGMPPPSSSNPTSPGTNVPTAP